MLASLRMPLCWLALALSGPAFAAPPPPVDPDSIPQAQKPPHPVHVVFYVNQLGGESEQEAVRQAVGRLKTVTSVSVDEPRGEVLVAFDQRDMSFHEIAQAIASAGQFVGKRYDPRVLVYLPSYADRSLRPKLDAILYGAKLAPLVQVQPLDAAKGTFFIHFLPLDSAAPSATTWRGFNGGSLSHPIHLPPPLGLGLPLKYASRDDAAIRSGTKEIDLWDGRGFTGWELVTAPSPPVPVEKAFRVGPDGALVAIGGLTGYLETTREFANYAFHAEWRWTTANRNNNSGFFVHIVGGPMDRHWPVSFQVQNKPGNAGDLIPMADAKMAELGPDDEQLNRVGPESERPIGSWNSCDVICRGDAIDIRINGVRQCWATRLQPHAGRIGFQLEGFPYELRNVTLTPLD